MALTVSSTAPTRAISSRMGSASAIVRVFYPATGFRLGATDSIAHHALNPEARVPALRRRLRQGESSSGLRLYISTYEGDIYIYIYCNFMGADAIPDTLWLSRPNSKLKYENWRAKACGRLLSMKC